MSITRIWLLLKITFAQWREDQASLMAAALAYYTVFSLAPLLIIVIAIAGAVFGEQAAKGELVMQMQGVIGKEGAQLIQTAIENASQLDPSQGPIPTLINISLLLSGVISTILVILGNYLRDLVPGFTYLWQLLNFFVSLGIVTLLFAMMFKILPDAKIDWKDVWMGAALTALLFDIGKFLLGFYLGKTSLASAYGAAGSLVIILTWVFYSAQILFLGAEFTQVYVRNYGKEIAPADYAMRVPKTSCEEVSLK